MPDIQDPEPNADSVPPSAPTSGSEGGGGGRPAIVKAEPRSALAPASMSLGEHLEELRRRLIIALLGLLPIAAVGFFLGQRILAMLIKPIESALRANGQGHLQAVDILETFMNYLTVSIIFTVVVGSPWLLYQLWRFVAPGLYHHERRFVYFLLPLSTLLTITGVAFLYFGVIPLLVSFFIGFGNHIGSPVINTAPIPEGVTLPLFPILPADPPAEQLKPGMMWINSALKAVRVAASDGSGGVQIFSNAMQVEVAIQQQYRLDSYIGLLLNMALAFAGAFQTPVVILLLGWVGILDQSFLRKYRKHAVFATAIVAAALTPGDLASMFLMWVPLYVLFELGFMMLRWFPASKLSRREPNGDPEEAT
jgi:sec-independent protein translocase protein TatC